MPGWHDTITVTYGDLYTAAIAVGVFLVVFVVLCLIMLRPRGRHIQGTITKPILPDPGTMRKMGLSRAGRREIRKAFRRNTDAATLEAAVRRICAEDKAAQKKWNLPGAQN